MIRQRQLGQSMTEYLIVLPALLLLVFGAIQFGLIYQAKTTLNYAVFEATRAGSLNRASYNATLEAFARGLAPLYTHEATVNAVSDARDAILDSKDDRICIDRVNPPDSAFNDFGIYDSSLGITVIPNDNLMYRDPTPGKSSKISIQDANLLKLEVTYCYELIVPIIKDSIRLLLGTGDYDPWLNPDSDLRKGYNSTSGFSYRCLTQHDGIPIKAQAIFRMQSAAYDDDDFSDTCG